MSPPPTQLDPQRLIELLTRQRDLYRQLRALSEKQRSMISTNRPELLLSILRQRQELVATLARLNEELAPFRRDWEGMYAALPEQCRSQVSELVEEINALLRVILQTDQEDGALLSARKQAVASELASIAGGQAANIAYAKAAAATPPMERTGGGPGFVTANAAAGDSRSAPLAEGGPDVSG